MPTPIPYAQVQAPPPESFVDSEGAYMVRPGVVYHPNYYWLDPQTGEPQHGPALIEVDAHMNPVRVVPAT